MTAANAREIVSYDVLGPWAFEDIQFVCLSICLYALGFVWPTQVNRGAA